MTARQKLFCIEYLKDQNATQAAKRAGYSKKTAYSIGEELLRKPEISEQINAELAAQLRRTQLSADGILDEIRKIAYSNMKNYVEEDNTPRQITGLDDDIAAAIQESGVEVREFTTPAGTVTTTTKKIKLASKLDALDKLAKHVGLYERDNMQRGVIKVGFDEEEDDDE